MGAISKLQTASRPLRHVGLLWLCLGGCGSEPDPRAHFDEDFSGSYSVRVAWFNPTPLSATEYVVVTTDLIVGQPIRSTVQGSGFHAWSILLEQQATASTVRRYRDPGNPTACSGQATSCWLGLPSTTANAPVESLNIGGHENTPSQATLKYPSVQFPGGQPYAYWNLVNGQLTTYDSLQTTFDVLVEVIRR
jgi:hypothetical protein